MVQAESSARIGGAQAAANGGRTSALASESQSWLKKNTPNPQATPDAASRARPPSRDSFSEKAAASTAMAMNSTGAASSCCSLSR